MKSLHYIFIVGCQRSGTTLLGQILGAHPQAILIDENNGVYNLVEALLSDSHNTKQILWRCLESARNLYAEEGRFNEHGMPRDTVTHLVLKTPNATYDFERLRQIHHPRMHFVFVVRDVRDVVCSMQRLVHVPMVENQLKRISRYRQLSARFAEVLTGMHNTGTADHVRKATIWMIKSSLYTEFTRTPLNSFLLRYEDLVSAPHHWIPRVLDHLNLPQSDAVLQHENVFQGLGPGFTTRSRKIDKNSLQCWSAQLTSAQEQDILIVASALMSELGYQALEQIPRQQVLHEIILRPVVAIGKGGSGTRLLSLALQEHGVFLGNQLNQTEDSIEWVDLIYKIAINKLTDKLQADTRWQKELLSHARNILAQGQWNNTQLWGWKLPETMLILPEVAQTFANAKIIHLVRHPLDTCLRRTHMTSRMNNNIGHATLSTAYQWLNWDQDPQTDEDYIRNTASWLYQLGQVVQFSTSLGTARYLQIKYEDLCNQPQAASDTIAAFLDKPSITTKLHRIIDNTRRRTWDAADQRVHEVWSICETMAKILGYKYDQSETSLSDYKAKHEVF